MAKRGNRDRGNAMMTEQQQNVQSGEKDLAISQDTSPEPQSNTDLVVDQTDGPESNIDENQVAEETGNIDQIVENGPEEVVQKLDEVTEEVANEPVAPNVVLEANTVQQSNFTKTVVAELEEYERKMRAGLPVDNVSMVRNQTNLFKLISRVFNTDNGFDETYRALLERFKKDEYGAFHEKRLFRARESLPITKNEQKAFLKMLNLIKVTCDSQSRELALKQIDFEITMQYGFTEQGRRNVLNFYNV